MGKTVLKIYETTDATKADFKVYLTTHRAEADLVVYKAPNSRGVRRDGYWFFVPKATEAEHCFYKVFQRFNCDLVICYTTSKYEAGWQNETMKYLLD